MPAISSTFDSQEPFLADVLREIHAGKIQLPDFQRPWVWDDIHIRSLLASVSLAYPIGAVMFLEVGGAEIRFRPRVVEGVKLQAAPQPDRLILDGQQRLTSLYGALYSREPVVTRDEKQNQLVRVYYFDIAKCLDPEEDRLDAVVSVPAARIVRSDFGRKIDLDVSTREKEYEAGLVPANVLLEPAAFMDWRLGYMMHFGTANAQKIELISKFEREVWLRLTQFKVPVIQLLSGTPKEAVCQVFEMVNTGGVALTVFELITATFAADDFPLREDWNARRDRLHKHDVLRVIGGTEFLQAVTLLASFHRHRVEGTAVSVKRKDVLRLTLTSYKAHADAVEEGLVRAARLLTRQCVFDRRNLPYTTQLVPLGVTCAWLGARFEQDVVRQKLARWYWCGIFGELYGSASESRYAFDVVDLCAWVDGGPTEPRTVRDCNFAPMRLLGLQTRQSAAYKGLFALMVKEGSEDFRNGDPIAHTAGFLLPVDIHHVFPEDWSKKQSLPSEKWNSVINKTPLTAETNRAIGGHAPSKYLPALVAKGHITEARLDDVLPTHLIDPVLLRADDFNGFLRTRAVALLDAIERVTGKPVSGRDAEDVIAKFGGSLRGSELSAAANQVGAGDA